MSTSQSLALSRRDFLKAGIGGLAAVSAGGLILPEGVSAVPSATSKSETLAATLFKSLSEEQRTAVCHSFDDPLRLKVDNNWHINNKSVAAFYSKDQQQMI